MKAPSSTQRHFECYEQSQQANKSTTRLDITQDSTKRLKMHSIRHKQPQNGEEDSPQTPHSSYTYSTYLP
jgi:hypothetical protein